VSREEFIPSLIDAFTYNGATIGIPKDFNTLGMFYNKDLFAAASLEEPTDDWTWDDLRAAAEALTDSANNVYGFGVPADAGRFPVFVFQNGGQVMNEDFSDTLLDSPEAVEAADFYTSFRSDGIGVIPGDLGEGWQGTLFGKGQQAMVYEGGWLIPYLADQFPDINYGVVTPPAGPAGEGNLIFTVSYVISRNSENPDAAWRLIEFLTNEESQTTVLESGFALPSRQSLQDSEYMTNNPAAATIFKGASEGAVPFMWGLVGSDVNDQMGKALERVYTEDQPPADALAQAAEAIREAIAQAE
jgi:multiple sugar transport system substrate-binding protein